MTTKSRTYPDISYVETDTETIVNTLIQGYEKIAGRTLYPADDCSFCGLLILSFKSG